MLGLPDRTGPGAISRCRFSREIGAVPGPRGLGLGQAQPAFDALDSAIHIIEAQLGRSVVDLHRCQVAFNRGHSGRQLAKPGLDTVEPLMDAREIGAEKIENVRFSWRV